MHDRSLMFLYHEFLENSIYQIVKVVFAQSLIKTHYPVKLHDSQYEKGKQTYNIKEKKKVFK